MDLLKGGNATNGISTLLDPFSQEKVTGIWIRYRKPLFEEEFKWSASVEFKNGKTSGKHDTKDYSTLEGVLNEIEITLKSL